MEAEKLYIIGGNDAEFINKIKETSNVIFLDRDQDKFKNKLSLIKEFQKKQGELRIKWLSFQEEVFKKIQTYLDKDKDFSYLLTNIFFEASPNKTNLMYKFFKLNIIFDYIKKENIKNIYLYNVPKDIEFFFNKNADKLNFSVITLKIFKKKQTLKKSLKNLAKKFFVSSLLYHVVTEIKKKKPKNISSKKQI